MIVRTEEYRDIRPDGEPRVIIHSIPMEPEPEAYCAFCMVFPVTLTNKATNQSLGHQAYQALPETKTVADLPAAFAAFDERAEVIRKQMQSDFDAMIDEAVAEEKVKFEIPLHDTELKERHLDEDGKPIPFRRILKG